MDTKELQELASKVADMEKAIKLASEGLLKSESFYQIKYAAEDYLRHISPTLKEMEKLRLEKLIPIWRNEPKIGMWIDQNTAEENLIPLISQSNDIILEREPSIMEVGESHVLVNKGRPFDGRTQLRKIFEKATSEIFIQDPYVKPIVLEILSEVAEFKKEVNVKILVGKNANIKSLKASFASFNDQFIGNKFEFRIDSDPDHPRYIIVDNETCFNPDNSLDMWGYKTTNIHPITKKEDVAKIADTFEKNWNQSKLMGD